MYQFYEEEHLTQLFTNSADILPVYHDSSNTAIDVPFCLMAVASLYLLLIGLSPFIFWVWVLSDPWSVIGFFYKLNRWQQRRYATYQAWQHTQSL